MTETKATGDSSFVCRGITYSIGEIVCLRPPKKDAPPFIGRIETIGAETHAGRQIRVAWYYRPEEAAGGRKAFHSAHELFKSDHFDWVDIASIISKCKVLTLAAFQALPSHKSTDFFARFSYKAKTGQFKPDKIPVYCVCGMPYNPDLFMVECRACLEWYHPECIGLDKATAGTEFICHECTDVNGKEPTGEQDVGSGKGSGGGPLQKKARVI